MTSHPSSSLLSPAVPVESGRQDVHISCPTDLVEPLVTEFRQLLADTPDAHLYDYGISTKYEQGYLVIEWKGRVPADFLDELNADPRLEGHSLSLLIDEEPVFIAPPRLRISMKDLVL